MASNQIESCGVKEIPIYVCVGRERLMNLISFGKMQIQRTHRHASTRWILSKSFNYQSLITNDAKRMHNKTISKIQVDNFFRFLYHLSVCVCVYVKHSSFFFFFNLYIKLDVVNEACTKTEFICATCNPYITCTHTILQKTDWMNRNER